MKETKEGIYDARQLGKAKIFMMIKVLKRFEFSLQVFCESSTRYPSISHLKRGEGVFI